MDENKVIVGSKLEALLPQRYPYLFVDRIEDFVIDGWAKGCKCIGVREPMLLADDTVEWPGAFVVESLGQLSIALINMNAADCAPPKILLGGVSGTSFENKVPMGCKLDLFVNIDNYIEGESFVISGHADVAGKRMLTMNTLVAKIMN